MRFDTKKLTRCALIAAVYVALTLLSNALNLAYGPIQLRFSEAMTVLPFLMPEASWSWATIPAGAAAMIWTSGWRTWEATP